MAKTMKRSALLSLVIFIGCSAINIYLQKDWLLTIIITFATITYHLWMRLIVGYIVDKVMKNKADYTQKWYQLHAIEVKIYKVIRVKKWKNRMPSYNPDLFSPLKHTWDEIAQAMCQAEVVHEINVIISFVPIVAAAFLDSFYVFLATSILAALFDLSFVIMQRYNRPRVIKMANRFQKHFSEKGVL